MDEIKKELLHVFHETPTFSAQAKANVLLKKDKSNKFRIRTYITVFTAFISFILFIVATQWELIAPSHQTVDTTLTTQKNEPAVMPITSDNQFHVTYNSLSMSRGNNEYVGDVVIDPTIKTFTRGDVVYIQTGVNQYTLARVVGLSGEKIEIRNGEIIINNEPLNTFYSSSQVDGWTSYESAIKSKNNLKELQEAFNGNYPAITLQEHELFIVTDNWYHDWFRGIIQIDTDIIGVALGMKHSDDAFIPSPMSQYPSTEVAELMAENIMSMIEQKNTNELKAILHKSASINNDGLITFHDQSSFDIHSFLKGATFSFAHYYPEEDLFEIGYRIEQYNISIYMQIKEDAGHYKLYNLYTN